MQYSVYVAGSFLDKEEIHLLILAIRRSGYHVTYDWTKHEHTASWLRLRRDARKDRGGIEAANAFVLVWPGRYSSATEMGMALVLEKPVVVYDPESKFDAENNLFLLDPSVQVVHSLDGLDLALRDLKDDEEAKA